MPVVSMPDVMPVRPRTTIDANEPLRPYTGTSISGPSLPAVSPCPNNSLEPPQNGRLRSNPFVTHLFFCASALLLERHATSTPELIGSHSHNDFGVVGRTNPERVRPRCGSDRLRPELRGVETVLPHGSVQSPWPR